MLEKNIENRLRKQVKQIGGEAYKFESPGNSGVPDRLIILPGGRVYMVETKKPKTGRVRKLQTYQQNKLRRLGVDVRVIFTYEQIDEFIAEVGK